MYPDFIACSPKGLVPSVSDMNGDKVWESLHVIQHLGPYESSLLGLSKGIWMSASSMRPTSYRGMTR